jgi:hypothetical protein
MKPGEEEETGKMADGWKNHCVPIFLLTKAIGERR